MVAKTVNNAIAKVAEFPAADQERIGRDLNAYLDDFRALRALLDEGSRSLDAGEGKSVDIEQIIARARADGI